MEVNSILPNQIQTWFEVFMVQTMNTAVLLDMGVETLEMEVTGTSEMLATLYRTTWHYIPEDSTLQNHFTDSQHELCLVIPHTVTSQLIYTRRLRNFIVIK
jgi:phage tail tube protein FII